MDFLKDKVFLKSVLLLSIPIALQNLVTSVLNIFDQMMVGWLPPDIADNSLSAVYLANQIVFIFEILIFAAIRSISSSRSTPTTAWAIRFPAGWALC